MFGKKSGMAASLAERGRYEDEIEQLHIKYSQRGRIESLEQAGLSFNSISINRRKVAKILAKTVSRGEYRFAAAEPRTISVGGKRRVIYWFRTTDRIVHGVVAKALAEEVAKVLSPRVYSYRKGTDWLEGVGDFAAYLRRHQRERPRVKDRGLYVLRYDIRAYTDTIPVGDGSPLWPLLRRAVGGPENCGPAVWALLQAVVRPVIEPAAGAAHSQRLGIPTGSPITAVLYNLCTVPLDEELDGVDGAFYARYSDDLLFAHPDPGAVRRADERIRAILRGLGLGLNEDKAAVFYFTGAGMASDSWPAATGTTAVGFLGCRVFFDGTVGLKEGKQRKFLRELEQRVKQAVAGRGGRPLDERGQMACAALNSALVPDSPLAQKYSRFLLRASTDRRQLRQLDYLIARLVLKAVTGSPSSKAFRQVSYRKIRRGWGLNSLYHRRNFGSGNIRPGPAAAVGDDGR